ncbi:MAG: ABC transporter permease subunit [Planctomycetes bacterium]|nr:ABC transporter permease subunit [Planctomycetota bacterium]
MLTAMSFIGPLALWCLVSYVPFIWHPDVRLDIAALRDDSTTIYTAGDHLSRAYFAEFVQAIRAENQKIVDTRKAGGTEEASSSGRRANLKKLRQLASVGLANGWLDEKTKEDDAAIYQLWEGLATGRLTSTNVAITNENMGVIRDNWSHLGAAGPAYSFAKLPAEPLLKLVPQGQVSNPDYLPPPHRVILTGFADWVNDPGNDKATMGQRLVQSVYIVFGGFLISCLIGIPLGILCGTYSLISRIFEPFIDFFRYMPAPAFSTLLVAILLAHNAPKIALVFIGTFFHMVLMIAKTTRMLDYSLIEAAQTLGADNRRLLTRVVIPGILPDLYNDLRILLGWAWTWLVIAELIGVKSGLTEFIETQGRWRNFDRVFPVIIMIGLLGFFTDQLLMALRRILFPWEYAMEGRAKTWFGRIVEAMRTPPIPPPRLKAKLEAQARAMRKGAADVGFD